MSPIPHFEQILDQVEKTLCEVVLPTSIRNAQAASLVATIFEMNSTCCLLFKSNHHVAIPGILRNILESYIDLLSLIQNKYYINVMIYKQLDQDCKMYKFASTENKFTDQIARDPDYMIKYENKKNERKKYHKLIHGIKIGAEGGFKRIGIPEYHSIYQHLCLSTHNNISVLEERHTSNDDSDLTIILFKNDYLDINLYIDTLAGLLISSLENFCDMIKFNSNGLANAKSLLTSFRNELFKKEQEEAAQ